VSAVGCALLSSAPAFAQDVEKQVARMNKRAMEDYDSLEFESARKTLIDAVAMLRANGYDESPIAAKTYINLGIIYISGFKDRNRGIQQFVNALKINGNARLDPSLATPELDEAFAQAQKQVGGRARPPAPPPEPVLPKPEPIPPKPEPIPPKPKAKPPEEPPPPPPPPPPPKPKAKPPEPKPEPPKPPPEPEPPSPDEVRGLQHNPVDESQPNKSIGIKAQLGSDTGATRMYLFFRGGGQEDFISVPMKRTRGAEWSGTIPGEAVSGRALQYYIEARDARGRAVVGSGSAPNPYIIAITETAAPPSSVPEVDVEDPLLRERLRKRREEEEKRSPKKFDRMFIFVLPGFGFGYEPGGNHTEVAWQYQVRGDAADTYIQQPVGAGGVAFAPFHIAVEIGGMITKNFGLSLVGRFQLVTGANAETVSTGMEQSPTHKAFGAVAALLRARYRFLDGKFHPYVHLDAGGGQIRHFIDLSGAQSDTHPLVDHFTGASYNDGDKSATPGVIPEGNQEVCANHNDCTDSIALGYLLLGGGAGIWYDFATHFAFMVDLNLLGAVGIGSGQSGMNIDISLGIGAHFL
jgi:outer membrane biosynthesis protein TonB